MGRPNRTNPGANHLDNGVIDDFAIRDRTDFFNGLTITRDSRASGTKDPTDADVPARGASRIRRTVQKSTGPTACAPDKVSTRWH